MTPVGNSWLRRHFGLEKTLLEQESFLGTRLATTHEKNGRITQVFPRHYEPKPTGDPLAHLEFGLKHDGVELVLLREVFTLLPVEEVLRFIVATPTGKYARKVGFLYEFLTGRTIEVRGVAGGYVPLLDPERYITAPEVKVPRWRIDDNLLGGPAFSPLIRKTDTIQSGLEKDWAAQITQVLASESPALLHRAQTYLYAKETRSSFLIEREKPGRDREQRFIAALRSAGQMPASAAMSNHRLIALQNVIVDPRYAEKRFRGVQNYVGETLPGMNELVHYISPPPELVPALVEGLATAAVRLETVAPIVQAAVTGFQFVFIHPFEDGNGRLHRFLLQDGLARRGVMPSGTALPLSASILDDLRA